MLCDVAILIICSNYVCSILISLAYDSKFVIFSYLSLTGGHFVRQNKKISVFQVTGLKILGRLGTHIFVIISFSG